MCRGGGTYVWVNSEPSEITVRQDFNGSFGLYLFRKGNYFAFSNSFWCLAEHVAKNHTVTVNYDFLKSFISADLCSYSYTSTPINEIIMLPRNVFLKIEKPSGSLFVNEIDLREHTVDLFSKEGMEILDAWFLKWTKILRDIKKRTDNIVIDLSGGFDSRMVLSLVLNAGIDLSEVKINSANDNKHCHSADFEIASKIARHFGFTLNNNCIKTYPRRFCDLETVFDISFYTKLGFHKEMYFKCSRNTLPLYRFPGSGGECLRGYPYKTASEYRASVMNRGQAYSSDFVPSVKHELDETLSALKKRFCIADTDSTDIPMNQYTEVRCRNHYGKATVENYFANAFDLTPLIDPDIRRLKISDSKCGDKKLLLATIYARYAPDLFLFEYEGGRFIDEKTISYAKKMSAHFKFKKPHYDLVKRVEPIPDVPKISFENSIKYSDTDDILKEVFLTKAFYGEFLKNFPKDVYDKVLGDLGKSNYFPLRDVYACVSAVKTVSLCASSVKRNGTIGFLEAFKECKPYLDTELLPAMLASLKKYATCRVDVKNVGEDSNFVEILDISDKAVRVFSPEWFSKNGGRGTVIQSVAGNLSFKTLCHGNGELKVWIRGMDIRDENKNRIPIWILCTALNVGGIEKLKAAKRVWHDEPYVVFVKVKDGEEVSIHLEWKPV